MELNALIVGVRWRFDVQIQEVLYEERNIKEFIIVEIYRI